MVMSCAVPRGDAAQKSTAYTELGRCSCSWNVTTLCDTCGWFLSPTSLGTLASWLRMGCGIMQDPPINTQSDL